MLIAERVSNIKHPHGINQRCQNPRSALLPAIRSPSNGGTPSKIKLVNFTDSILNYTLPPWRSAIARALHRNRSLPNARYVQLATVDRNHRPQNRSLVFRGWLEPESQVKFVTDVRSTKAMNLLADGSPWAEVCWYFPKTREQFRLSGTLTLVTAACSNTNYSKARQEAWEQMSDSGRIQFDWGTPGADRSEDPQAFNPPQPDALQPSLNFCLLLLDVMSVKHLELRGEPQNCYFYELVDGSWTVRSINP
jgi:pyridoxamine 5'-phosphate oxidase